jgi:hypothetical protein
MAIMPDTEQKNDAQGGGHGKQYDLIVNRVEQKWPTETITGAQIKKLAGSPSDWVVNQIVDGPGEDPEVGNDQAVHLDHDAPPKGKKKFTTRKPSTSPGAGNRDVLA